MFLKEFTINDYKSPQQGESHSILEVDLGRVEVIQMIQVETKS